MLLLVPHVRILFFFSFFPHVASTTDHSTALVCPPADPPDISPTYAFSFDLGFATALF